MCLLKTSQNNRSLCKRSEASSRIQIYAYILYIYIYLYIYNVIYIYKHRFGRASHLRRRQKGACPGGFLQSLPPNGSNWPNPYIRGLGSGSFTKTWHFCMRQQKYSGKRIKKKGGGQQETETKRIAPSTVPTFRKEVRNGGARYPFITREKKKKGGGRCREQEAGSQQHSATFFLFHLSTVRAAAEEEEDQSWSPLAVVQQPPTDTTLAITHGRRGEDQAGAGGGTGTRGRRRRARWLFLLQVVTIV